MRAAAVVTSKRLMVVADQWDVENLCSARAALWRLEGITEPTAWQVRQYQRFNAIVKRGLG